MRSPAFRWTLPIFLAALAVMPLLAQGKDPRIGVWTLNVAKSTFPGGNSPKSQTRTYEDRGGGVVLFTQEGVSAQGTSGLLRVAYKLDGLEYPQAIRGSQNIPMISQKLVDPYTIEFTIKVDGKVTNSGTQVVSKDGKTLTYKQQNGVIQVFEKQ